MTHRLRPPTVAERLSRRRLLGGSAAAAGAAGVAGLTL
ncbi:twin-arginine translocation signal domain-containing protein, partial [Nocardia nova]